MKTKVVNFKSYDGYELEGTMVKADNERGAVLFVHGITSSRDELGFHSDYSHYLSINGISNLRFDYRYHGINETSLENLSLCGIVNDIDAAFTELQNNTEKTVNNFFIIATSFGGGLSAFWVDFFNKSEIKKLILNAPVINYENDVLERINLLNNGILSDSAQKQLLKLGYVDSADIHFNRGVINELKYINGITAIKNLGNKVVIFHGDKDDDVPLESSQKYMVEQTTLKTIPNVGHGFGIDIDEDLTHPETKKIHQKIYEEALKIIEKSL